MKKCRCQASQSLNFSCWRYFFARSSTKGQDSLTVLQTSRKTWPNVLMKPHLMSLTTNDIQELWWLCVADAASKHAVQAFFDCLRAEVEEYGISVSTISHTFISSSAPGKAASSKSIWSRECSQMKPDRVLLSSITQHKILNGYCALLLAFVFVEGALICVQCGEMNWDCFLFLYQWNKCFLDALEKKIYTHVYCVMCLNYTNWVVIVKHNQQITNNDNSFITRILI